MHEITSGSAADAEWQRLRPVIDAAMDGLREEDREAVLLWFFEGQSLGAVGTKLRLTENAARMRVERALDNWRVCWRGVGSLRRRRRWGSPSRARRGGAAPAGFASTVAGAAMGEQRRVGWARWNFSLL